MTCRIRTGDWKDKTMNLEGKRVLVVGSGKSGVAAAELLRKKGITFVLFDGNKDLDVTALIEKNPVFAGAEILLGELAPEDMARIDLVVLSPGVPTDLPMVNELRNRQIPIWGEIELAYHFAKGRIIAITGTNGKTTTTSLVGEIMANYFDDVKVVGNIGIPYTSVAADTTEDTVTVAEISSFQLETTHEFAPEVTAILNITPDHLNRHHTMECYIETKESITKNQTAGDTCVLNYEDEVLRRFGETLQTKVVFFSSKRRLEKGLYLDGEDIFYADGTTDTKVINVNELNILGKHNYENVMAAVGMSVSFGVPMDKIVEVLKRFQAVEHRIEYVTEKRGVKFYNDSGIGFNSCVFAYSSSQFRPSQTEMGQTALESVAAHIRMAAGMAKNIAFPLDFNSAPTAAGVPLQSSLPPSMTATRDAKENASSKRCSVRIIVVPSSRLILPSVAKKSDAAIGSS